MSLVHRISRDLQLPISLVHGVANRASHAYKVYMIPKRTGGQREIHHPSRELKALQRWLLKEVISSWTVHDAAHAYREGVGIRKNAAAHVHSRYLLRMDLVNFFPSITSDDLQLFLNEGPVLTEDWDEADRAFFVQVTCRYRRLTIGAPTSPALSNAVCFRLDDRLAAVCVGIDATYTRYADDLFFSTNRRDVLHALPSQVETILGELAFPLGLRINRSKTRHSSKKGRRLVTGLVLSSDGTVSLGRDRKRFIRRQIYRLELLAPAERSELAGLIAFAMSVEPDIVNQLIIKYGRDKVAEARSVPG